MKGRIDRAANSKAGAAVGGSRGSAEAGAGREKEGGKTEGRLHSFHRSLLCGSTASHADEYHPVHERTEARLVCARVLSG